MLVFHRVSGVGGVDGRAAFIPTGHALLPAIVAAVCSWTGSRGGGVEVMRDVTCIVLRVILGRGQRSPADVRPRTVSRRSVYRVCLSYTCVVGSAGSGAQWLSAGLQTRGGIRTCSRRAGGHPWALRAARGRRQWRRPMVAVRPKAQGSIAVCGLCRARAASLGGRIERTRHCACTCTSFDVSAQSDNCISNTGIRRGGLLHVSTDLDYSLSILISIISIRPVSLNYYPFYNRPHPGQDTHQAAAAAGCGGAQVPCGAPRRP